MGAVIAPTNSQTPAAGLRRDLIYRFADCTLDGRTLELTVRGALARLEPKPLELLMFLLRHGGEVVTKDELQDAIWPGRILSESVLTKTVARLRQALGDEEQAIIRTVHGFGYRLLAPVTIEAVPNRAASSPQLQLAAGDVLAQRPDWRLVERLGAGGLGEVWLAMHARTSERRVFKFALDAHGLTALKREITLFRVLRDTHGDRPDLIRLLDWNVDEAPYFVESEYAAGGSLSQWADARGGLSQVPLAIRIELIAQTADALAAAHAAGVLHKDLKPGNLLIQLADGDPARPRVLLGDFGSGRVLDLARLERLEITRLGFTRVEADGDEANGSGSASGTPFYFAPELLAGQQPTAQTDLYALGVILFQTVVGDLKRPLTAGWEREIADPLLREDIAVAAAGHAPDRLRDAAELAHRLRHLPQRRAAREARAKEAAEADALRQSLVQVTARRRLMRAVSAALALGLVVALWQFGKARDATREAQASAAEAEAVARFVTDDLLGLTDPFLDGAPQLSVRDLLVEASRRLDQRTALPGKARARILMALGKAHEGLGDWPAARTMLTRALADAEAATGPESGTSLRAANLLAYAMVLDGDFPAAGALYARVMQAVPVLGADHPLILDARDGINFLATEEGHYAVAVRGYEQLGRDLLALGLDDRLTDVNWTLPELYLELGRTDDAERTIRAALDDTIRNVGAEHPRVHWMRLTLGDVLMQRNQWDAADAVYLDALNALERLVGPEHPYTLTALHYHGHLLLRRGDPAAAVPVLQRALDGRRRVHGERHLYARYSAHRLAQAWTASGRVADALPVLRSLLSDAEADQGARHPNALDIRCSLAEAWLAAGKPERAEALIAEALPWAQRDELAGTERRQRVEALAEHLHPPAIGGAVPESARASDRQT